MRTLLLTLMAAGALLAGCGKELDLDELDTNPFDRDYAGPDVIVKVVDSTWFNAIQGAYNYRMTYRVRTDLFPRSTAFYVSETASDDGIQHRYGPFNAVGPFVRTWTNVTDGEQFCLRVALEVDFSHTKTYDLCGTVHE
ncbi:MAG TPA: hypothetical protein VHL57_00410 [Flavobacteriales bacterium]|jgi:hypothetical protein|nr:hypothetical protein [Flavobacteriales bacterium]